MSRLTQTSAVHGAVVAAQRRRVDLDPAAAAAQALDLELDRGRFAAEDARRERSAGRAMGIGGQHVEPDTEGAGTGVELDEGAAGRIEIEDRAVAADERDGVGAGVEDGAEARFALRELPVGLRQPVDLQLEFANPGGRRDGGDHRRLADVIASGHRLPGLRARHRTRSLGLAGRSSCRAAATTGEA